MLEGILPDSMITMKDGSYYPINKIKCGDFITTFNESTSSQGFDMVVSRHSFMSEKMETRMFLIVNNFGNNIVASGGTEFLTNKGWTECRGLNPASDLLMVHTNNGFEFSKITKIDNFGDCIGNGVTTQNNLPFIANCYVIFTPESHNVTSIPK